MDVTGAWFPESIETDQPISDGCLLTELSPPLEYCQDVGRASIPYGIGESAFRSRRQFVLPKRCGACDVVRHGRYFQFLDHQNSKLAIGFCFHRCLMNIIKTVSAFNLQPDHHRVLFMESHHFLFKVSLFTKPSAYSPTFSLSRHSFPSL